MSIEVKEVTRSYGRQKALDSVSFSVARGEITGFIGPNGAGKSTMMKIITGYLHPDSGSVLIDDVNIAESPLRTRAWTGYLPEHNPLYLNMYVKEYLEFTAGLYGLKGRKTAKLNAVIEKTGLGPEQHKTIGALSKGYRQRVGLAQAIIHDPKILILDEPTSGLDPNQIVDIRTLISELGRDKTVMLSTHIMQEVEAICHKIILINKGKIVADNLTEELISHNTGNLQTVQVEFNKQVAQQTILDIQGVKDARPYKENQWIISGTSEPDVRTAIFAFAVQNQLVVLSIQRQEKTMEQVFHELTRD
jgi:ABC-2 type transport system ATP-binding protein